MNFLMWFAMKSINLYDIDLAGFSHKLVGKNFKIPKFPPLSQKQLNTSLKLA